MNEIPCKCGHSKIEHLEPSVNGIPTHLFGCSCMGFKADNLKYLESLVDKNLSK